MFYFNLILHIDDPQQFLKVRKTNWYFFLKKSVENNDFKNFPMCIFYIASSR